MKNRHHTIFLILVVLLVVSSTTRGQETTKPKMPQRLNQILDWLPADTETLVVANGPFQIPQRPSGDRPPLLESARSLSFILVTHLQKGLLQKLLQGQEVLIAVEASRRFTSPKGLGLMPFEGCQILHFDASAHDALQAAVETCFEKAPKAIRLGGTKVAVFAEKCEDDEWSLLVAQPRRGVLLCATNEKFLEQVLARMRREHPDRAFPDNLPEWQHVNVEASVWGIRHYSKGFADTDPSSPLRPPAAANVPDSKAVGFVFWFDARPAQVAKVRYLSSAKDAVKIVEGWFHPSENIAPTIKEFKPGVIEVSLRITDKNGSGLKFLVVLYAHLGHAVFL